MAIMPEMFNIRTAAAPLLVASHPGFHFSEGGGRGKREQREGERKVEKKLKTSIKFLFKKNLCIYCIACINNETVI